MNTRATSYRDQANEAQRGCVRIITLPHIYQRCEEAARNGQYEALVCDSIYDVIPDVVRALLKERGFRLYKGYDPSIIWVDFSGRSWLRRLWETLAT